MIHSKTPITLAETKEIVDKLEEKEEIKIYLKKFASLKKEKAEKLKEEIKKLNSIKIKEEHLIKIVDFLPHDQEAVRKILNDVSLTEEETNAILQIVAKY